MKRYTCNKDKYAASCRNLFSFPMGGTILIPFTLNILALVLTFKCLTGCDLILTKWSIDCSTNFTPCLYTATLGMGQKSKDSLIKVINEGSLVKDMEVVCRHYTEYEDSWLLDRTWKISSAMNFLTLIIGMIGFFIICLTTSIHIHKKLLITTCCLFGINSLFNAAPLLIYLKSELCTTSDGLCDPTQTYCVSDCSISGGSFVVIASCLTWISSSLATYGIIPRKISNASEKPKTSIPREEYDTDGSNSSDSSDNGCQEITKDIENNNVKVEIQL